MSKTTPTRLDRPLASHRLLKGWPCLQPCQVVPQHWIVLQKTAVVNHTCPPHIKSHHTICSSEFVPTHELLATEVVGEDIGTDVELALHGFHQCSIAFVGLGVGELHVQWLQDDVKCRGGVADDAEDGDTHHKHLSMGNMPPLTCSSELAVACQVVECYRRDMSGSLLETGKWRMIQAVQRRLLALGRVGCREDGRHGK